MVLSGRAVRLIRGVSLGDSKVTVHIAYSGRVLSPVVLLGFSPWVILLGFSPWVILPGGSPRLFVLAYLGW